MRFAYIDVDDQMLGLCRVILRMHRFAIEGELRDPTWGRTRMLLKGGRLLPKGTRDNPPHVRMIMHTIGGKTDLFRFHLSSGA